MLTENKMAGKSLANKKSYLTYLNENYTLNTPKTLSIIK